MATRLQIKQLALDEANVLRMVKLSWKLQFRAPNHKSTDAVWMIRVDKGDITSYFYETWFVFKSLSRDLLYSYHRFNNNT